LLDVLLASLLLVLFSPVILLVALAICMTSRGPAFFRQTRVGRGGECFRIHKFRTMKVNSPEEVHREYVLGMLRDPSSVTPSATGLYKLTNDHRVTRVGKVLRRTSLDELPQLLDVVAGHMSLVGPRPMLPWEAEAIGPAFGARLSVTPGITGMWQVSGRSRLTMHQALALDVDYVRRQSLLLDLKILARTAVVVVAMKTSA
jgi:lipopolysaccharide/colanic/teichoic acid biosynthesis glycosyltransferase